MWISVYPWASNQKQMVTKLQSLGIKTNLTPEDNPETMNEICINVSAQEIIDLRHHYDVMIRDVGGKDYLLLDTMGKQFSQR